MAIDPSIVLGIKPPPVIDPVDQYAKIQGVRNMISQQQLRQQQAQMDQAKFEHEQQQNAEGDRAAAAAQLQGKLLAQHTTFDAQGNQNTDYGAVAQGLAAAGHGKEAQGVLTQQRADQKAQIDNQKTQIETLSKKVGLVSDAAQSLLQLPDQSLAPAYDAKVQELAAQGLIKPGQMPTSAQILQQANGDPAALRQNIAQIGMQATQSKDQADIHQKELDFAQKKIEFSQKVQDDAPDTAKKWTDLVARYVSSAQNQSQLDAALKDAVNAGAPLPVIRQFSVQFSPEAVKQAAQLGMTTDQAATTAETAKRDAEAARHNQADETVAKINANVNVKRSALDQKKFDMTFGSGLTEDGKPMPPDPVAKAIAEYQMDPPSARSMATPGGRALMTQVLRIDPSFDATKFPERKKITLDYSASGATGKAMTSTDTALAHLNAISEAGRALDNGNVQILNKIANSIGAQVGGSAKVTYDAIVSTVAPEISKAVIGAAGGEGDRKQMANNFSSSLGTAAREGAVGSTASLLGARFKKQSQAYEQDMGKPLARKLSSESQSVLDRYSGGSTPNADSGGPKKIGSKAEYDALAKGAKYIDSDGQTYTKK